MLIVHGGFLLGPLLDEIQIVRRRRIFFTGFGRRSTFHYDLGYVRIVVGDFFYDRFLRDFHIIQRIRNRLLILDDLHVVRLGRRRYG